MRPSTPEVSFGGAAEARGLDLLWRLGRASADDARLQASLTSLREALNENDEALRWAAMANGDGRWDDVADALVSHKGFSADEAGRAVGVAKRVLEGFAEESSAEDGEGKERSPEEREAILRSVEEANDFFRPSDAAFAGVRKVEFLPSGRWSRKESGFGVRLGDTYFIAADPGNMVNATHEYLHSFINNITAAASLSGEELEAARSLAGRKIRNDYGDYAPSLVNESLIRAYRDGWRPDSEPYQDFERRILEAPVELLSQALAERGPTEIGAAKRLKEDRAYRREYYNAHLRDRLLERAWRFYRQYDRERQADPSLRFEDYFRQRRSDLFSPVSRLDDDGADAAALGDSSPR